jgi:hypothetical protein
VWWRCESCGHEWMAQVAARSRSRGRRGCPACARRRHRTARGTLAQERPELVGTWDALRNGPEDSPDSVTCGSGRKFWWVCESGHSWQARVADRASGNGCPVCAGHYLGTLVDTHPGLAAEWDTEANDAGPESVTAGSVKEAAWLCPNGHRFVQAVHVRSRGSGCPVCAGYIQDPLAVTHPHLVRQWDSEANGSLPSGLTAGSDRKFWWRCPAGHRWRTSVKCRSRGHGCPECASASAPATMSRVAPRGEAHAKAKLTWSDVAAIRTDSRSNHALARIYGVSHAAIGAVRRYESWRTPDTPPSKALSYPDPQFAEVLSELG